MLHDRQAKIFGQDMFVTFESSFGSQALEDLVVLEAEGPHGEDFVERYGIDLVTQILFDLLEEEAKEREP